VKLRFTLQALSELNAILDYISERSPQGGERVRARLLGLAGFIQGQPHGGRKTSEPGLRRIVATPYPYVVFYEIKDEEVVIVGVRHGARDPGSMPGEGGAA
jgi:toxin ParE1/3/4